MPWHTWGIVSSRSQPNLGRPVLMQAVVCRLADAESQLYWDATKRDFVKSVATLEEIAGHLNVPGNQVRHCIQSTCFPKQRPCWPLQHLEVQNLKLCNIQELVFIG